MAAPISGTVQVASNHIRRRGTGGCVLTTLSVAIIDEATQAQIARKPTRATIMDDVEGPIDADDGATSWPSAASVLDNLIGAIANGSEFDGWTADVVDGELTWSLR